MKYFDFTDDVVQRIEKILITLNTQSHQEQRDHQPLPSQSFTCFLYGEHFAYLSGTKESQSAFPAFSPDWYRYGQPCFKATKS